GTLGTATTPMYPLLPEVSGITSGFDAYDIYTISPDELKYYNTLSPYTQLYVTIAGNNRSVVDVTFTRNVTPNWNLGANFRSVTADRQVGGRGRNDRRVESYFFDFHTFFKSKNEKYRLMAQVARFNHEVFESGGVVGEVNDEDRLEEFFRYNNSEIYLREFKNREFRINYHLYHEYQLNERLQVYHELDRNNQNVFFFYEPSTDIDPEYYFRRIFLDTARTADRVFYDILDTEAGVKGSLGQLFYSFHYRLRRPQIDYSFDPALAEETPGLDELGLRYDPDRSDVELYGGFDLRLDLGENTFLAGGADYQSTQNYRVEAEFTNPILKASYIRMRKQPTYLSERFVGNHNAWRNDFEPVGMDQLSGSIEYQFPNIYLRPFATITNINQPIYYRRDSVENSRQAFPVQAGGGVRILSPGVAFQFDFLKRMHLRGEAIYTLIGGRASEAFSIPTIYTSGSLYYENSFIDDKVTVRIGTDLQFTPSYLAYDYDVATQQFFTQQRIYGSNTVLDNFETPYPTGFNGLTLADFFLDMKIRTAIVYLRVPFLNQGFPQNGYFTTPFYVGQGRTLDLGIRWRFFD
ncbi:MAG: putative porin, partial [bacterium]